MFEVSDQWIQIKSKLLNFRSLDALSNMTMPEINKCNMFPVTEYNQVIHMLNDIKQYLRNINTSTPGNIICRTYFSDKGEYICYICDLNIYKIKQLCNLKIYGFWGGYFSEPGYSSDYFFMEVGVKLDCRNIPLEIKTINAGKYKRLGRGSLGIRFLEEELIPAINKILVLYEYSEPIGYIYGISADLSEDTNALARSKFYCRNGFKIINSHFYKSIVY